MKNCKDCNKQISRAAVRCSRCAGIAKVKITSSKADYKRDWVLRDRYGITLEEFHGWWIASYGKCYLCSKPMAHPEQRRGQSLDAVCVDHCHKTGKMRGLLCGRCNRALGFFNDDPQLLRKAIEYLGEN